VLALGEADSLHNLIEWPSVQRWCTKKLGWVASAMCHAAPVQAATTTSNKFLHSLLFSVLIIHAGGHLWGLAVAQVPPPFPACSFPIPFVIAGRWFLPLPARTHLK
jgi:hypothetical protein